MRVGVDYYPEHWEEDRWETDAALMEKAGLNIVRLAEFAWIRMEPEEGVFDFAWLDRVLETLGKHGISAILCTPTATMPGWAADKYPETLAMQADGTRTVWGVRKNNCFTSASYRGLSRAITEAMARHFADNPNVAGWQTDNEFAGPYCYCDTCRKEWQNWLKRKYGTLENLAAAWGTHFWGHTPADWREIVIPVDFNSHNPGACLDYRRYHSWLQIRFQHEQVKILREYCPTHFITHNCMGTASNFNTYEFCKDLDFASFDNYPVFGAPKVATRNSFYGDMVRGHKKKNYWIMEQTSGPGGWGTMGRNPRPGEIRQITYSQLAHGMDGMIWFRWRTCTTGREQYWHGVLGHDGKPLRRYNEVADTTAELHKLWEHLEGTTLKPKVALVYDYDCEWATQTQASFNGNAYMNTIMKYYDACFRAGVHLDVVQASDDLSQYNLVIASQQFVLPDSIAQNLIDFVKNGGVLLTDIRTGVKDEYGRCHERTLPGLLSETLGIEIPEYECIGGMWGQSGVTYGLKGTAPLAGEFTATGFCDWLETTTAETLVDYDEEHMSKFAAVTRNRFGKGTGIYVGTVAEEPEFYDALLKVALDDAGITPPVTPPEGVEVTIREKDGAQYLFLVNHKAEEKTIDVPAGCTILLRDTKTADVLTLAAYDAVVLALK